MWLYSLGGVDIHARNDFAFRSSCVNNKLNISKWLYSLGGIDIRAKNDCAFKKSCRYRHLEVAKWLTSICEKYIIVIQDNEIVEWKIR